MSPKTKKPCFNIPEQGEVPSGTRPGLSPIYVQVNPKPPARTSSGATRSMVESVPTQNNPSNIRTGESLLKQNSTSSKSQTSVMSVAQVSNAEPTPPTPLTPPSEPKMLQQFLEEFQTSVQSGIDFLKEKITKPGTGLDARVINLEDVILKKDEGLEE